MLESKPSLIFKLLQVSWFEAKLETELVKILEVWLIFALIKYKEYPISL